MIKQRNDSISQFKSGGRNDLAEKEEKEVEILSKYKPTISFTETSFFLIKEIISLTDLFSSMRIYYYLAFLMDARVISFISSKVAFLGFCP